MNSLSTSPSVADSIWGVICKKVHLRNNQAKRVKLYLKWKNNSHNIRELLERIINPDSTSQNMSFFVSLSLDSLRPEGLASLQTSVMLREISQCMSLSSLSPVVREEISWESIEPDLQDDRLLLIWSSSASDLVTYHELKQKDERVSFDLNNSTTISNTQAYYYYNNSQAQLWVDGCNFYGYRRPSYFENFLNFENMIDLEQCDTFVRKCIDELLLIWSVLNQINCKCIDKLFKKQYALLTNEQLSEFVHWITDLRDQFSSKGVDVLKIIYTDCLAIIDNPEVAPELSPLRENVPLHLVNEEYDADDAIKCSNNIINNVNDTVSKLHGCNECNFVPDLSAKGEIFLDVDEWNVLIVSSLTVIRLSFT